MEDMACIPIMLSEWLHDYRFYIRHYTLTLAETIFYAIPKEREAASFASRKRVKIMAGIEITTFDYSQCDYDNWKLPFDYHCLYILENGKDVYIGETKDAEQRSKDHNQVRDLCYRYSFTRIHILTGETFEETPAKHFETLLIQLMKADGKFHVLNTKKEWQHYFRKNIFELCFDQVWLELEKIGLVKHKDFQSVLNLSQYKFSPNMPLTKKQCETLTSIIHTIDSKEMQPHKKGFHARPILISGDPGTGKTVVATSLFYYLKTHEAYKNLKIGLVYASSATRAEIQEVFKSVPNLRQKDVISPITVTKEKYDIIICDEAQRLRRPKNAGRYYTATMIKVNRQLGLDDSCDELDWLLTCSKNLILFYDEKQSVCASDITKDSFFNRLKARNRGIRPIALTEQLRIRAGSDYVSYIYDILYQRVFETKSFNGYEFKLFQSFDKMVQQVREKENAVGLCRLCGGYAWMWTAKEKPEVPDIQIETTNIWWNKQTSGWLRNPMSKEEMGSIYTLPGLDLNYAAVVIGPELYYDPMDNQIKVNRSHLYDNKVKVNTTEEDLKNYILNTYGVFMTRGIMGTYIYVCDNNLREYLKGYIPL